MSEYMKILKMIEDGKISPAEGVKLLQESGQRDASQTDNTAMGILDNVNQGKLRADEAIKLLEDLHAYDPGEGDEPAEQMFETPPSISDEEMGKWKQWWTLPLYIGVGIVALSAFWISSAYQNSGYGFWFFCAWVPMLIGLLFMAISWGSRSGPWIHVRVRGPKEKIAVSIPAPLGLTGWALNTFGHHIPRLERTSVDEILTALKQGHKNNAPLYVHVDEGEDGEKVEVFIG